jgi:hypothetical protein
MGDVREVVRERYGRIAAEAPAEGCCGGGSSCGSTGSLDIGYSEKELSQIPEGANLGLDAATRTRLPRFGLVRRSSTSALEEASTASSPRRGSARQGASSEST